MTWNLIGKQEKPQGGASDLIKIEDKKKVRLLLHHTNGGPVANWIYAISTPADDYRTWVAPDKNTSEDFFALNRSIFSLKPIFSAYAYDYDEQCIKILESGNMIWESIKDLYEAGKDLGNRDLLIRKKGSGRTTEYSVVDCDPTPAPAGIDTMQLPDLYGRYVPATKEQVLADLAVLGFTNPEDIFVPRPLAYAVAKDVKIPFGKYKDKTMGQLVNLDTKYIDFLAMKIDRLDIKESARVVANQLLGTNYPLNGITPTMDQVTFVAPTRDNTPAEQPTPTVGEQVVNEIAQPSTAIAETPEMANDDRDALISTINAKFASDLQYKDFMKIIDVMRQASAPMGLTSINDFNMEQLENLKQLIGA